MSGVPGVPHFIPGRFYAGANFSFFFIEAHIVVANISVHFSEA